MSTIEAALAYADRNWPVFPCRATADKAAGSKAPHLQGESSPGARDGGHWLASTEPAQLRAWWQRWPDALIGLPTGRRTGTVVLDLDPREYAVEIMLAALTRWSGHIRHVDPETGEVFEPAIARTQSGGLHLFFAWPDAEIFSAIERGLSRLGQAATGIIGNRTNLFRAFLQAAEAPIELAHIDVRGEGGYVIAAPSVMENGRRYEWLVPPGDILPALPRRLRGAITGEFIPAAVRQEMAASRQATTRFAGRAITDERVRTYVERSVRGALNTARSAAEGNRNAAIFWAACRLGEFVRGGFLGAAEAETLLLANLPKGVSPGERKLRGTIRNGLTNTNTPAFSAERLRSNNDRAA